MFRNRFAQHALLAAAVSSAASFPQQSSAAPADTPARTASANPSAKASGSSAKSPSPPSYAPGSVNDELQKLFKESGQEMPSMRQQDLPNGQNLQSHLVRPKTQAPPKKNVFQKMWGKITGSDSSPNATAAAPPVPPSSKLPTAAPSVPPAGHSFSDNQTQSPRTIDRLLGRQKANPQNSPQSKPLASAPPAPKPTNTAPSPLPATVLRKPQTAPLPLVQPGAAPTFMGASASKSTTTAKSIPSVPSIPVLPADPLDSLDINVPDNDVLDLDAVAKSAQDAAAAAAAAAASAAAAAKSAATEATSEIAEELSSELPSPADLPAEFPFLEQPQSPTSVPKPSTPARTDNPPANTDNPFTGVALEPLQEADPTLPDASTPDENTVAPPSEPLQSVNTERMRLAAELAERQRQLERILERGDMTGFKGFCPVALRDQRQLVDAQPQIQSTFGLNTWTFSSDEARLAFEANPTRYAPVAGGADPVLLTNDQQEVPGQLDFALWFRGRLHLFSSRDTMATFLENPQQFAVAEPE